MRALVVYESIFGNTERIALAVAEGLGTTMEVRALDVARAPAGLPPDTDLLVVGCPTHAHGMTTPKSRADAARRPGVRPGSTRVGVREWIEALHPPGRVATATFDTRIKGPALIWGSAAKGAARLLQAAGCRLVRPPESFLVEGPTGPLENRVVPGEVERAREWARALATTSGQRPA